MVGLINLFLSILKHPSAATAASDVAVLDIVVGHFGHLEVLTSSELAYPFAREVAALAYKTVKNAKTWRVGPTIPTTPPEKTRQLPLMDLNNVSFSREVGRMPKPSPAFIVLLSHQDDSFGVTDFDMESWNIFGVDGIPSEGDMIYFPT